MVVRGEAQGGTSTGGDAMMTTSGSCEAMFSPVGLLTSITAEENIHSACCGSPATGATETTVTSIGGGSSGYRAWSGLTTCTCVSTRETVTLTLGALRRDGLVDVAGRRLILKDKGAIQARA